MNKSEIAAREIWTLMNGVSPILGDEIDTAEVGQISAIVERAIAESQAPQPSEIVTTTLTPSEPFVTVSGAPADPRPPMPTNFQWYSVCSAHMMQFDPACGNCPSGALGQ